MGCAGYSAPALKKAAVADSSRAARNDIPTADRPLGYASALVEGDTFEVTYSGPWRGSRDDLEGGLLYRSAVLAREHGSSWFRFLHMPGEDGPLSHPSRSSPSFGAAYGHWQPHWSYRTEAGWQPWHPEWGDWFWADRLEKASDMQVQVHAMIELRGGAPISSEQTDFEVAAVLRDLRPFNR